MLWGRGHSSVTHPVLQAVSLPQSSSDVPEPGGDQAPALLPACPLD